MSTLKKHLSEPWFTYVEQGFKKVEGRLNDPSGVWSHLKIGDRIEFFNDDLGSQRIARVKIVGIRYYPSFKQMLQEEKLKYVLPGIRTYEEGVAIYHQFYHMSDEERHGIVALELEL
jgi:ASC-1-like (ASCH) protein